ncbi:hypothetical protein LguiA_014503 [Lonicera macranthoides]
MNTTNKFLSFFLHLFLLATILWGNLVSQVETLNFNYPNFTKQIQQDFITTESSNIAYNAMQVTLDLNEAPIGNLSGRIWYKYPFKLWSKQRNITASFNSTFTINISPQANQWGEGLAFILSKESGYYSIPSNSDGQWLGIVNASTNGSSANHIFAVEFDTRKSYPEDIDGNHVGVDVNSVYSIQQVSLNGSGVNLSRRVDVTASVQYDGELKSLEIYVFMSNMTGDNKKNPILKMPIDLSDHLPEYVYAGFSASTGEYTQLNCVASWSFMSKHINEKGNELLWVGIAVSVVLVATLSGIFAYQKWGKKEKFVLNEDSNIEVQIRSSSMAPKKFSLKEIQRATGNFNPKNVLGKGGCGIVYKGMLSNTDVAVKRFSKNSSQGKQEFVAEVTIIGTLHHKNLVKLVGWCYESNEFLVVYEFMPNGSLDKLIFCNKNENEDITRSILSWERRHGVIYGVAQALDYLHNGCEKRVLHRDIKASNIMLDLEYNAKLGDFGLARTIQVSGKTHHSTKEIAGTPGYMAPESFHTGRATVETDIYAFGVLILEVTCGRKPGNHNGLNNYNNRIIDSVWELYRIERLMNAIDIRLNGEFDEEQVERVLRLGLACCNPNPYQRPTMRVALQVLNGEVVPPAIPDEKPAFMWPVMAPLVVECLDEPLTEGQQTPITVLSGR